MMAMRALRVIADLQVGGVQRMMLRTLRGLRDAGVESEVCCQRARGALADTFESEGFPVHLVSFRSRLDLRALVRLRRLISEKGFDVVHAHQYQSNIAVNTACIGGVRARVINSYHSSLPVRNFTQALQLRLTRGVPSAFIAVSDAVREALLHHGVPAAKTHVIHNGVPLPPAPAPFPKRGHGEPVQLIYAGRFVSQKRLTLMLDVVKRCVERGIPVHCTMLGEGPIVGRIRRLAGQGRLEGAITLPGVTHDVPSWLAKSDLYISTSEREGFANALLECCAAGRGFIASDIPPHREMLGDSGAGFLVGDSPDAWADILEGLARDRSELERLGAAAFQRVQDFSEQATCQKLLDLYSKVLE